MTASACRKLPAASRKPCMWRAMYGAWWLVQGGRLDRGRKGPMRSPPSEAQLRFGRPRPARQRLLHRDRTLPAPCHDEGRLACTWSALAEERDDRRETDPHQGDSPACAPSTGREECRRRRLPHRHRPSGCLGRYLARLLSVPGLFQASPAPGRLAVTRHRIEPVSRGRPASVSPRDMQACASRRRR